MEKAKKRKWLHGFLLVLALLLVVFIVLQIAAVLYAEAYRAQTRYMLQNGPFCNEGIWKDPEGDFYLVSLYTESETFTEVTAYVRIDGIWKALRADVNQGTNIISFTDSNGYPQMKANALLNDDKSLTLSKVRYSEDFGGVATAEWKLIGYSWEELGEQLPFEVIK
jgi:hypothetical protein